MKRKCNKAPSHYFGFGDFLKDNILPIAQTAGGAGLMFVPGGQVVGAGMIAGGVGQIANNAINDGEINTNQPLPAEVESNRRIRPQYSFNSSNQPKYKKGGWIQSVTKSIKKRGTEGVCTGSKFGSSSCPPGSRRYNLAKTFKKMAKKHATGGFTDDEQITYYDGGNVPLHEDGGMDFNFGQVEGFEGKIKVNMPDGQEKEYIVPGKKVNDGKFNRELKTIDKKFSKSHFDPIEKKDKNTALLGLIDKVEQYKQDNGLFEYSPKYAKGGEIRKYWERGTKPPPESYESNKVINDYTNEFGIPMKGINKTGTIINTKGNSVFNTSLLPSNYTNNNDYSLTQTNRTGQINANYKYPVISNDNTNYVTIDKQNNKIGSDINAATYPPIEQSNITGYIPQSTPQWSIGIQNNINNKENLPTTPQEYQPWKSNAATTGLIGLGATTLGNIPTFFDKPEYAHYDRLNPNYINLGRAREKNAQEADLTRRLATGIAKTTGNLNSLNVANAGIQRNLGQLQNTSYLTQEATNAAESSRVDTGNAAIQSKEVETNQMEKDAIKLARRKAIQNIISGVATYGTGIAQGNSDTSQLQAQASRYGYSIVKDPTTGEMKMIKTKE